MPTTSEESASSGGRSFLQRRLTLFGAVLTGITLLGCAIQVATTRGEHLTSLPTLLMFASSMLNGALWVVARGRPLSTRALRVVEAFVVVANLGITGAIPHAITALALGFPETAQLTTNELYFAELGANGAFSYVASACILTGTYGVVLRAALVPSSARRTFMITVAGGVLMAAVFVLPLPFWPPDAQLQAELIPATSAAILGSTAIWWTLTTIVCVVLSRVIHGLRREIRSARRLGQYQLEAKIGEGGMGIVYRAQHALLRRPTAIKLLPPDKVGETSVARFEREVRLTATLTHPNTVTIYDYGRTPDGVFYYAMELLDGASLSEVVAHDGPQPAGRTVHVLRAVAGALREAHGRGLVHRDIKPGNIVLCAHGGERDVPMLLDFGLVKQLDTDSDAGLTQDTSIAGTPAYLAPELIRSGAAAGPASDLYALGAVAYFMLTGAHVFEGANVVEVCSHHLHTAPVPPSQRLGAPVPEALERLVLRLLAKEADSRPSSAEDLLERLDVLEGVEPWTRDQRERWWERHEGELGASAPVDETADTLLIDVEQR